MKMISSDSISDLISPEDRETSSLIQNGRIAAISWIGIARKSSGRVADYLQQHGFEKSVIIQVLDSLQEDGYIDDERIAKRLIRQRQGRQGESKAALAQRMRRLGLAAETIESAIPDAADDLNTASALISSRFGRQLELMRQNTSEMHQSEQSRERFALMQKIARFLATRGFGQTTIMQALRNAGISIDSME